VWARKALNSQKRRFPARAVLWRTAQLAAAAEAGPAAEPVASPAPAASAFAAAAGGGRADILVEIAGPKLGLKVRNQSNQVLVKAVNPEAEVDVKKNVDPGMQIVTVGGEPIDGLSRGSADRGAQGVFDPPGHLLTSFHTVLVGGIWPPPPVLTIGLTPLTP
jgi:hypothetical protein